MATLKEQALLERVGQLTVQYEDKIADLRVELTNVSQQLERAQQSQAQDVYTPESNEVLEGNIVQ